MGISLNEMEILPVIKRQSYFIYVLLQVFGLLLKLFLFFLMYYIFYISLVWCLQFSSVQHE